MHSVVVFGDIRHHHVEIEKAAWEEEALGSQDFPASRMDAYIPGGAWMMASAIRQMATECKLWHSEDAVDKVIYGFDPPESDKHFCEITRWNLEPRELTEARRKKARLSGEFRQPMRSKYPPVPEWAKSILSDADGRFEDELGDHPSTCPDIVVLDDLNLYFKDLQFVRNLDGSKGQEMDDYRSCIQNAGDEPPEDATTYQAIMGLLFDRFQEARKTSLENNVSFLEPVIICSVREKPGKIFNTRVIEDDSRQGKQESKKTTWLHLLDDPWLRRRVVVILDAQDLRSDGLAISTGLSWERTAQDTISQMRHSKTYRQFLQFGHVIVRYGVTGALHIANSGFESGRTYRLFFDPERDDTTWNLADRDGVVLGDSSVYVAHLVKSIQQECRKHRGAPELFQLASTVRRGITGAIQTSQLLSRTSYGNADWSPFYQAVKDDKVDVRKRKYFPDGIFCTDSIADSGGDGGWAVNTEKLTKKDIRVVSASIPPSLQREWSILMQSAMIGAMETIARRIIQYGATNVFNFSVNDSYPRARESLTQCLVDVANASTPELQDENGFLEERITEHWPSICKQAVERFNNSAIAPKGIEEKRRLSIPDDALDDWKVLQPSAEILSDKRLWHHLNSAQTDEAFERILVFAAHQKEPGENGFTGFSRSLRADPIITPLVRYGKPEQPHFIVDRREVEGYRAIDRLMRQHLHKVKSNTNKRPLCIALFGPPGSGKSFAVKAINSSIQRKDMDIKVLPAFNLGQYTNVDGLENAFQNIASRINDPKAKADGKSVVPIAFFDEFDSTFGEQELGWLKFFLAPMEDGVFKQHNVQNAILVFAGGTRQTFNAFSMANRPPTDEQWIEFSKAKGPDFASRLSGHLDIIGVNTTGAEDELFMIRRSLLIRSMLSGIQGLVEGEEARIDPKMSRALLKTPEFRNGGRSIRMLLELCLDQTGFVSASGIPPIHQLNMHVDGKAFLDLMHEQRKASVPDLA